MYLPSILFKIAGRNINSLRYADDTTLMAESEEELKSLLMKVKKESQKVGLKFNIHKTKIMASGPITSWQNTWRNSANSVRLYFFFTFCHKGGVICISEAIDISPSNLEQYEQYGW